jgi:3D (Asp-Asp-Asp) domain-containing protein
MNERILDYVLSSRSRVWLAFWSAVFAVFSLAAEGCAGRFRPNTPSATTPPEPALPVTVTAYCTGKVTATGDRPTEETVAADPDVLPIGSRIRVSGLDERYNRTYVVMDTGSKIRGRRIDLYMRNCREAVAFGRRSGSVTILR